MFRCLGGGSRRDGLEDELAWLKLMLQQETLHRQAAQEQLRQEQTKCAVLEQEIQHAVAAAHEMGESLQQFFSRNTGSGCSDQAFQWGSASLSCLSEPCLAGSTPQSTDRQQNRKQPNIELQPRYHDANSMHDQNSSTAASMPANQHHNNPRLQLSHPHLDLQQSSAIAPECALAPHSSYSSSKKSQLRGPSQQSNSTISQFSPLLNRQPTLSHKSSAKMKRQVLQVADQLKDLAVSWQQRLNEYQPLHSGPAIPAAGDAGAIMTTSGIGRYKRQHLPSPRVTAAAGMQPTAGVGLRSSSRLSRSSATPTSTTAVVLGHNSTHTSWTQKQQQLKYAQPQDCQASTESLQVPAASGSSLSDPPYPTASVEWGSSSCFTDNHSSSPPIGVYDVNGDVSSSTGSLVRYSNSVQPYGVTDIAEGEEGSERSEEEQQQQLQGEESQESACSQGSREDNEREQHNETAGEEGSETASEEGSCITDEDAEAQLLQWHSQQVPQHQSLTQQTQQQQGTCPFSAWNQPKREAAVPRCAITRGAASYNGTPPSSRGPHTPDCVTAAGATPAAAGHSPLAAGVAVIRSNACARTPPQQHQYKLQAQQYTGLQDTASWQQQQQCKRQQQLSLRQRESGASETVPHGLKSMAPLRRHQQYLGTTG